MVAVRIDRRASLDANFIKKNGLFANHDGEAAPESIDFDFLPMGEDANQIDFGFIDYGYHGAAEDNSNWDIAALMSDDFSFKNDEFVKQESLLSQVARSEDVSEFGASDEDNDTLEGIFSLPESEESSDETENYIDSYFDWDGSVRTPVTKKGRKAASAVADIAAPKTAKAAPKHENASLARLNSLSKTRSPKKRALSEDAPASAMVSKRHKASLEEKRTQHNEMERKRREELKEEFGALKKVLPDLGEDKTPKIFILEKANQHIQTIALKSKDCKAQTEKALADRTAMVQKMDFLRRLLEADSN